MIKCAKLSLISMSVASLLLASTTSFAAATNYKGENYKGEPPCPVEKGLLGGFYLGVQGGYDIYRTNVETNVGTTITQSGEGKLSSPGWVGGGMLGYGMYIDQWYLGGEIFGNGSGANGENHNTITAAGNVLQTESEVKVTANYGIDFIPGYKINNDTLVYGRLGYNWARVEAEQEASFNGVDIVTSDDEKTNTVGGFHWGVGMESMVYENFSLRAEYTYTKFRHIDVGGEEVGEFTPADNQFMVGLLYHFA